MVLFLNLSVVFDNINHGIFLERLVEWGDPCFGSSTLTGLAAFQRWHWGTASWIPGIIDTGYLHVPP